MHRLKKHLVIFQPQAYPSLLKWTTYPVNVAMSMLKDQLDKWNAKRRGELPDAIPFCWVEVLSMLERCTAGGYTGSMKLIPKQLGTTLWFGLAAHGGFLPCMNSKVVEFPTDNDAGDKDWIVVHYKNWPLDKITRQPLQSSTRCHELEYSPNFVKVCAFFNLSWIIIIIVIGFWGSRETFDQKVSWGHTGGRFGE